MRKTRIYDSATVVLHWAFASSFVAAFVITKAFDDESRYFSFHMIAGIMLLVVVLIRTVWGAIGSRHALFSSFPLSPVELPRYFAGLFGGKGQPWSGHNPASAWVAILMWLLALGLAFTGFSMINSPNGESWKDLHELCANGMVLTIALHLSGLAFHSMRYRDPIALSMLDGKKAQVPRWEGILDGRMTSGFVVLGVLAVCLSTVLSNFDTNRSTLSLFGRSYVLSGERVGAEGGGSGELAYEAADED